MSRKNGTVGKDALNTVVGRDSVLEGSFDIHDGLRVDGTLKGQLSSSGTLVVGPSGKVEADPVRVRDAVIAGQLSGKLEASHMVRLESTAVLVGDITAEVLVIEEGAVFRGLCDAGEAGDVELPASIRQDPQMEVKQVVG